MREANDVTLAELLGATTKVINDLLRSMPVGMKEPGYIGNRSDVITGIRGINVFLYTDGGIRGEEPPKNLQVNGPEPLIAALVRDYPQYDTWGRARGHVVFHLV